MTASSVAHFRTLVGQIQQASDPEIKRALSRLALECKEKLADAGPSAADFFDSVRQSLGLLRGHGNIETRVSCLYDCAQYFYTAGHTHKAILAARDGLTLSRSAKNEKLARKGLTFLGNSLADWGAVGEAIECHVAAIELANLLGDDDARAISTHNLGVALIYAAQYQDAIACFNLADSAIKDPVFARSVHLGSLANKALCYLRLDRISEGLECIRQSIAESGEPTTASEALARAIRECSLVQLSLEAGNIELAMSRRQSIKDLAARAKSQKTTVMALIVEGLIEIHRGDPSRGLELLGSAREQAANTSSLVQDALVALAKGYDLLGRHKQALECLQQLMTLFAALKREATILQLSSILGDGRRATDDLTPLKHREAVLRAKVAEEQLLWSQIEMLERLAVTADLREEATGEHGYRVGRLSAALAEAVGMGSETCLSLDLAARLHDIGKIAVPDRILLTSEELKEAERRLMCQHTVMGSELLAKSNIAQLRMAEEIALLHHEWWDGSGYPKGLAGKRIPIHARIVALADVFDALTHGRPYAEPWTMDAALEEITRRRGTQFDPELTDVFLRLVEKLRREHADLDEYLGRAGRNSPFLQARRKIKLMLQGDGAQPPKGAFPGNQTRH